MRLVTVVLIILLFVFAGIVFGALNPAMVAYDLGFARVHVPKGAAVLAALFVGWLVGGIVAWLGTGAKHRRQGKSKRSGASKTASADGP